MRAVRAPDRIACDCRDCAWRTRLSFGDGLPLVGNQAGQLAAGRRVRRLVEQRDLSTGTYAIGWDGRDDAGALVPPGVYYARLRIDTDTEGAGIDGEQVLKTIAVAY